MSTKRRQKKRSGAVGLLFLELIGVLAFAFLITTARGERQAAADHNTTQAPAMNMISNSTIGNNRLGNRSAQQESAGWNQHRPQFSEVMGNIWEAGF